MKTVDAPDDVGQHNFFPNKQWYVIYARGVPNSTSSEIDYMTGLKQSSDRFKECEKGIAPWSTSE